MSTCTHYSYDGVLGYCLSRKSQKVAKYLGVPLSMVVLSLFNGCVRELQQEREGREDATLSDEAVALARDKTCVKECQRRYRDKIAICALFEKDPKKHKVCLANARSEFDNCLSTCGSTALAAAAEELKGEIEELEKRQPFEESDTLIVAARLTELAILYSVQDRYEEAKPLLERSLAINEEILGGEHTHVAYSLENYADVLRRTGSATEAHLLETRAEAIWSAYDEEEPKK